MNHHYESETILQLRDNQAYWREFLERMLTPDQLEKVHRMNEDEDYVAQLPGIIPRKKRIGSIYGGIKTVSLALCTLTFNDIMDELDIDRKGRMALKGTLDRLVKNDLIQHGYRGNKRLYNLGQVIEAMDRKLGK